MTNLRQKLASGNQLLVFEAAARHRSFTQAAAELNVTQPAVSRMVARFEDHIGLRLFLRSATGLQLTEQGQILYEAAARGTAVIVEALEQLQKHETQHLVTLSVSSAFVSHWMIARFNAFKMLHPKLELRFQLTGGEPSGPLRDADLGVRFVQPDDGQEIEPRLVAETIFAVCSPSYAREHGTLESPRQGLETTLVGFSHPPRDSWQSFFEKTNLRIPPNVKNLTFPDYSVVIQAALSGQGIALGWNHIVHDAVKSGLLISACNVSLQSGEYYKLFARAGAMDRRSVRTVAAWLKQEVGLCTLPADPSHWGGTTAAR